MRKRFSVDRIEEETVVCIGDDKEIVYIPRAELPASLKEGDVLCFEDNVYRIDTEEAERRREEVRSLLDDIFG